jgi:hypothetical protein
MVAEAGDKEDQKFLLFKNRKNITNFGTTDQSKSVLGEKKLLDGNFEIVENPLEVENDNDIRPDKLFHSNLPVINLILKKNWLMILLAT